MPKDLNQDRQQIQGYSPNQIIFPITSSITGNPQAHILQGPQQIQNYSVAPQMFTQSMIGTQGVPRGIAPHQQNIVFPQNAQPFVPRQAWRGNSPNVQAADIQNGFAPPFVNQQGYQVIQPSYIRYPPQQQYANQPLFIVSTPAPPHQGYQSIQPIQAHQAQQQQVHDNQPQQNVHIQQQQYIQSQAQIVQPQYPPQTRKIKIVDPNSGKDITSDIIVKKKEKTPHGHVQHSGISAEEQEKLNKKAKIAAQFAAQVAAAAASSPSPSPIAQPAPVESTAKTPVVAVSSKEADTKLATSHKESAPKLDDGKDDQKESTVPEKDGNSNEPSDDSGKCETASPEMADLQSATEVFVEAESISKTNGITSDAVNVPDVSQTEKEIKIEKEIDVEEDTQTVSSNESKSLIDSETSSPIVEVKEDSRNNLSETQVEVEKVQSEEVQAPSQAKKETLPESGTVEQDTTPAAAEVSKESLEIATAEIPKQEVVENAVTAVASTVVETEPEVAAPAQTNEPDASNVASDNKIDKIPSETSTEDKVSSGEVKHVEAPSECAVNDDQLEENKSEVSSESVLNGHDESAKSSGNLSGSAFSQVPKKKTKKQRMRDIQEKENAASGANDLLSAFVDKPVVEEVTTEEPVIKEPEKSPEDETWEEKEKTIEKEVITNADVEEREIIPKMPQTTILQTSADTAEKTADEKLQYDRDFLLKFQFSPICTAKPDGLPNIEIVLDRAHAGTKALDQGQRMSGNDFMPTFMRSQSGGRQSGGQRSKGGRGGSDDRRGQGGQTPRKIITVPNMQEKVELKKSDNAWVRPEVLAASMDEETKALDEVKRNVRSILNKLTPQKFQTLVSKMVDLKIDNQTKLESAIDLIFEKAVSEPGFSVAYANMCRVLTDAYKVPANQPKDGNKPGSTMTFRKILLNKCQKEFESESSAEKSIEADKEIHFDSEEKEKAWKEEIAHREWLHRKRTLGNIRFIGELFKLKMISENIMHDCVVKLLRSPPKTSSTEAIQNEDSLECLCQLLTTIGKDLDHEKAKPRMDQYFVQMDKIIRTKKISSRIKFAICDVVDLRKAGWKSRKDDNPKTIDQIHKEAAQAEKEMMARLKQSEMKQRLDNQQGGRRGPGGRDSPRGPPQAGGDSSTWQSVPAKGRSMPSAPVDASKFRLTKKTDSENISLGPGGFRPSAWAQGASGGSSRPGSGSNTPTSEMDTKATNRFSALSDSNVSSFDAKARGGRGSQQGRRGTPQTMRRGDSRDDRNAALRAVKDMMNPGGAGSGGGSGSRGGSRNQSPARPTISQPAPAPAPAPAPKVATPPPANVSREHVAKVAKATVEEYFGVKDLKGAAEYVVELQAPHMHNVFIEEAFNVVIEKKQENRTDVGVLINYLLKNKITTDDEVVKGISAVTEFATDIAIDIPHIYKYLGEIIGPIVYDGCLPLNKVKDSLEILISENKAGHVMAETLAEAVKIGKSEDAVAKLWASSGLTWKSLLKEGTDVNIFVQDMKMGFTMRSPSTAATQVVPPVSHASSVQAELHKLLKEKADNNTVFSFIESKVPKADQSSPNFIRDLSYAVCESAVKDKCQCDQKLLENRSSILLKFIDTNKTLESQALFSIVKLANDLNHPKDLLRNISEILWNTKVISEETFYSWEKSSDFREGKGVALSSLKGFISSLRDGEDDDEEEMSQPSTST